MQIIFARKVKEEVKDKYFFNFIIKDEYPDYQIHILSNKKIEFSKTEEHYKNVIEINEEGQERVYRVRTETKEVPVTEKEREYLLKFVQKATGE